jgi:serine/threonine protein kinase
VRGIVEQIAKGLRAFHRKEMLHQDIRPDNIMIDATGTVKIIDFGSTRITGVVGAEPSENEILGTQQFTAPEYFIGEPATPRSDLFSLGVITYQMLTGRLPYGTQIANARTRSQFNRLVYRPASHGDRDVPQWIDGTLEKAVHPNPDKRYDSFSEFLFDLRHPNVNYLATSSTPLIERNPLLFWKSTTIVLVLAVIVLLAMHMHR